eukprot:g42582.t1
MELSLERLATSGVGGDLWIQHNEALTLLTGLERLASVGGSLFIVGNEALTSLTGLTRLASVGGDLWISHNPELTSLAGLQGLTTIGSTLAIEYTVLTSLKGLENVTFIGDSIRIFDNPALASYAGFEYLTTIPCYSFHYKVSASNRDLFKKFARQSCPNRQNVSKYLWLESSPEEVFFAALSLLVVATHVQFAVFLFRIRWLKFFSASIVSLTVSMVTNGFTSWSLWVNFRSDNNMKEWMQSHGKITAAGLFLSLTNVAVLSVWCSKVKVAGGFSTLLLGNIPQFCIQFIMLAWGIPEFTGVTVVFYVPLFVTTVSLTTGLAQWFLTLKKWHPKGIYAVSHPLILVASTILLMSGWVEVIALFQSYFIFSLELFVAGPVLGFCYLVNLIISARVMRTIYQHTNPAWFWKHKLVVAFAVCPGAFFSSSSILLSSGSQDDSTFQNDAGVARLAFTIKSFLVLALMCFWMSWWHNSSSGLFVLATVLVVLNAFIFVLVIAPCLSPYLASYLKRTNEKVFESHANHAEEAERSADKATYVETVDELENRSGTSTSTSSLVTVRVGANLSDAVKQSFSHVSVATQNASWFASCSTRTFNFRRPATLRVKN